MKLPHHKKEHIKISKYAKFHEETSSEPSETEWRAFKNQKIKRL